MSNEKNSATINIPNKIIAILVMVGGGALFFYGVYIWFWHPEILRQGGGMPIPFISAAMVGGLLLFFGSPIVFAVKSKRHKKRDSMSQSDLAKMFDCPSSGNKGAVYLIKLVKDPILVKLKCPNHSGRRLRIPLRLKDQCVPYFQDAVFRCFKCGQESTVDIVKISGPWTLIKLSCPTHGNKLPYHKIWNTVYSDISNGVDATP